MSAPAYRWVCHKCATANPPGLAACKACGFQALATGKEIAVANPKPEPPQRRTAASISGSDVALFFPEILPAAVVAAASPFWLASLLAAGQYLAAAVLLGGVAAGVSAFVTGMQMRSRWLAYVGVVGVLVAAYGAHTLASA